MEITVERAAELLAGWDKVLVLSHGSPDGDTLGSATALMRGLTSLGKQVAFRCADPVGKKYEYLFQGINQSTETEGFHVVTVDVADPKLLGSLQESFGGITELAIDHHGTHIPFGKEEWVEPKSASTCQMIFRLLLEMNVKIDVPAAECLYTGIATDTGCFRYGVASPDSHRAAAELIALGADAAKINRLMFETKTMACMEVERTVLKEMKFYHDNRVALISIPKALVEETGAEESELEGLPSIPRSIEGVRIGITLKEKEGGVWKASVRTNPPVDASAICKEFGGGGHTGAAGCTLGTEYDAAVEKLIAVCRKELERSGGR